MQACGYSLPQLKMGEIWCLVFEKKEDLSLGIWVNAPFGDFLPKKKRLEHIHMIAHGGVAPKIISTKK